jgi:hypothetical protein
MGQRRPLDARAQSVLAVADLDAITHPYIGLQVYVQDDSTIYCFDGTAWQPVYTCETAPVLGTNNFTPTDNSNLGDTNIKSIYLTPTDEGIKSVVLDSLFVETASLNAHLVFVVQYRNGSTSDRTLLKAVTVPATELDYVPSIYNVLAMIDTLPLNNQGNPIIRLAPDEGIAVYRHPFDADISNPGYGGGSLIFSTLGRKY